VINADFNIPLDALLSSSAINWDSSVNQVNSIDKENDNTSLD